LRGWRLQHSNKLADERMALAQRRDETYWLVRKGIAIKEKIFGSGNLQMGPRGPSERGELNQELHTAILNR